MNPTSPTRPCHASVPLGANPTRPCLHPRGSNPPPPATTHWAGGFNPIQPVNPNQKFHLFPIADFFLSFFVVAIKWIIPHAEK